MDTKQATYVTLAATDRVSFYNWRGNTRIEIYETKAAQLEISDVNTDEILRAVAYFVRNVAGDSDRTETQTRILTDIVTSLQDALKVKEEV